MFYVFLYFCEVNLCVRMKLSFIFQSINIYIEVTEGKNKSVYRQKIKPLESLQL